MHLLFITFTYSSQVRDPTLMIKTEPYFSSRSLLEIIVYTIHTIKHLNVPARAGSRSRLSSAFKEVYKALHACIYARGLEGLPDPAAPRQNVRAHVQNT